MCKICNFVFLQFYNFVNFVAFQLWNLQLTTLHLCNFSSLQLCNLFVDDWFYSNDRYVYINILTLFLSITIFLLTSHLLVVAGDGVDEEHLAHIEGEGEPATEEESDSKIFRIVRWRIKRSPDTVNTVDQTEVQIQTKLDPTTL